jgi:FAD/FMN-containing dehydrogenase
LDKVTTFLARAEHELPKIDQGVDYLTVCHLGDGNLHFGILPSSQDPAVHDRLREKVEEIVLSLGGSFSAEHGIGLYKLNSMRRRKDKVALDVMRAIKAALDPKGLMNPGKVLP